MRGCLAGTEQSWRRAASSCGESRSRSGPAEQDALQWNPPRLRECFSTSRRPTHPERRPMCSRRPAHRQIWHIEERDLCWKPRSEQQLEECGGFEDAQDTAFPQ